METVSRDTSSTSSNVTKKWQPVIRQFLSLSASWLIVLLLLRVAEWLLNGFGHQFPDEEGRFLVQAFFTDLLFFGKVSVLLFILFLLLSFISSRIASIVYIIIAVSCTLGYLSLIQYFNATLVPLGADLYGYSWQEIEQTVGASGKLNVWTLLLMGVVIFFIIMAIIWLSRRIRPGIKTAWLFLGAILVTGVLGLAAMFSPPSFSKEYDTNLAFNKLDYFFNASWQHFFPALQEIDIYSDAYIGDFGSNTGKEAIASFAYPDEKTYPFLHADSTADVLSSFLKTSTTAPNIVILLVEGLGRAFTNDGAYLGNWTPFLDSLSQHSLYWENFLSGGGRTFAVLPTLLGSLPFGKNGFNELGTAMPPHLTLVSLLKKNAYFTTFYYGGDASFDKMSLFLQRNAIDEINDKKTFPAGYTQLPATNGFTWGYGDKELFRYYFTKQSQRDPSQPALQVLLTVATHSPFLVNNQSYYEQAFEKRLTTLKLTDEQKREHRQYKMQFASVLYADDALQNFFQQYSQLPDYANTIFLITGDHRLPEIPMASKIDRYHVPLILYSPMLTRTARFQSISTHFDITPTLLAWLKNAHAIKMPAYVSWMGTGIDTARNLRNVHAVPLMQTKTDLLDFVMGSYHLNGTDVFRVNNGLNEEKLTEINPKESMQAAFSRFQQKNQQFIQGAPLIPDSIYKAWHP